MENLKSQGRGQDRPDVFMIQEAVLGGNESGHTYEIRDDGLGRGMEAVQDPGVDEHIRRPP